MYRIIKGGAQIAVQDKLSYIRKNPKNGLIVGCAGKDAQGVVVGDAIYHLEGRPVLPGIETVRIEEFDGAGLMAEMQEALALLGVEEVPDE